MRLWLAVYKAPLPIRGMAENRGDSDSLQWIEDPEMVIVVDPWSIKKPLGPKLSDAADS